MMQLRLLTTLATLLITQTTMAATNPFPCPTVRALQSVGVSSVMWHPLGGPVQAWAGIERSNNYYTGVDWTFIIAVADLDKKPKNEILASTNAAISNLILLGGPYQVQDKDYPDSYYCEYLANDGSSEYAVAVTPSINLNKSRSLKLPKR